MDVNLVFAAFSILVVATVTVAVRLLNWVWFRPKKLEECLRKQGFNGNPYRILLGDMKDLLLVTNEAKEKTIDFSDDIASHVLPYNQQIVNKYGKNSFIWFGPWPRLHILDPELVKEVFTTYYDYQKVQQDPFAYILAGGLLTLAGEKWAKHRKILNPVFHLEKLKNMVPVINLCCRNLISKWEELAPPEGSSEVDVWPYLGKLTNDVISRTAFGSRHKEGERIFQLLKEQIQVVMQLVVFLFIPGWRYLPTKAVRRMKKLSDEVHSLLKSIISKREETMKIEEPGAVSDHLLGILLESNLNEIQEHGSNKVGLTIEEVIEECKLFYLAGSESTSNLLAWTMIMLSKHQEWQVLAREEVLQVFGNKEANSDGLNQLRIVTMILNEVLRMYPPGALLTRMTTDTIKLGEMILPAGVQLALPVIMIHHSKDIWGDDVKEFKPQRFSEGILNATGGKVAYFPFSFGPRTCIGQNFALLEAKVALATILQNFSFELAPSYKHSPCLDITLHPQHGAPLILHKL